MGKNTLLPKHNQQPEFLFQSDDIFVDFCDISPENLADDHIQEQLIQSCKDNPDMFGRDISQCMRQLAPYLSFPKEYEHGLTEIIIEANRLDKHSYFPIAIKDTNGHQKTILVYGERTATIPENAVKKSVTDISGKPTVVLQYQFHHNHYISLLRKTCKAHPYLFKYGFNLMGMLLSWKATFDKNIGPRGTHLSDSQKEIVRQKQRENIYKYYYDYVRIKIAESRESSESATTWIGKPVQKSIKRTATVLNHVLDMPTDTTGTYPVSVLSLGGLQQQTKKKKKLQNAALPSLFQQTGDAQLDDMLDHGREYVEKPSSLGYHLKPGQILLRKYVPHVDEDRPKMKYEFQIITPKYLQKHFTNIN